jgi:putative two-component system response regulator
MPPPDGFELLQVLPRESDGVPRPVMVLTADPAADIRNRALAAGARDFLTKPFDRHEVRLRVGNLLETRRLAAALKAHGDDLDALVERRTAELERSRAETMDRLALAAEYRDDDTGQHAQRVARTATLLAGELGLDPEWVGTVRLAAPLHDLGKIAVPDSILLKPGRLTPPERAAMQLHVDAGWRILRGSDSPVLQVAAEIARTHHERWDGDGYLEGLRGDAIPLSGRLVAVADVFDALVHERPYKQAFGLDQAVEIVVESSGSHFDPAVVEAFLNLDHAALLAEVPAAGGARRAA